MTGKKWLMASCMVFLCWTASSKSGSVSDVYNTEHTIAGYRQGDDYLTIDPESRHHSSSAGTGSIDVFSNVAWTAASNNPGWIIITSGTSGVGDGTIHYSITANGSSAAPREIPISRHGTLQAPVAWELSYPIHQPNLFAFYSASDWSEIYNTPTPTPSGPTSPRTGTITVSGGGITREFTIYQDGTSSPTPTPPHPTHTAIPTHTPDWTPTGTPTSTPTRTPTPLPTWTPTWTPTPDSCLEYCVHLDMGSDYFYPGKTVWLTASVCNPEYGRTIPFWVILEVEGLFWFAPSWSDSVDFYSSEYFPQGLSTRVILPEFTWPNVEGEYYGARFWGALTTPDLLSLLGQHAMFTFGWGAP